VLPDGYETWWTLRDGTQRLLLWTHRALQIDGRDLRLTTAIDVTDRREREERLQYLAYHDDLTGLANRRRFLDELEHRIASARRYGEPLGVVMIDVDGLKQVNDRLGHAAGDDVLHEVATRLRARLRRSDLPARLGGDEFAVLLSHADGDQAEQIAADLAAAVAQRRCPSPRGVPRRRSRAVPRVPAGRGNGRRADARCRRAAVRRARRPSSRPTTHGRCGRGARPSRPGAPGPPPRPCRAGPGRDAHRLGGGTPGGGRMSRSARTPDVVLDVPSKAATALLLADMECRAAVKSLYESTVRADGDGLEDDPTGPADFDALLGRIVEARARVLELARGRSPEGRAAPGPLTRRQLEILRLVADGVPTGEIARRLYLSRATVRNHVAAALRALGAHSRIEAVAIARRQELL
jgi:diguanylate cyclase (GGDEF)-like protein